MDVKTVDLRKTDTPSLVKELQRRFRALVITGVNFDEDDPSASTVHYHQSGCPVTCIGVMRVALRDQEDEVRM